MRCAIFTRLYLATAAHINMVLRPFGLILMAEFEGEPPERPFTVQKLFIQRRSAIGLWK